MLFRVARFHRKGLLPILPVPIAEQDRDGRSNGLAMANAGEKAGFIFLDAHSPAPSVSLLAAPQLAIHKLQVNGDTRRHAGKRGYQRLSVRLSSGVKTQHKNVNCNRRFGAPP